ILRPHGIVECLLASPSSGPGWPAYSPPSGCGRQGSKTSSFTVRVTDCAGGFEHVVVYEKADRLGGTWRENTSPGLSCDVPSHFYSYSFALNPEWTHRFSPGPEILAYLEYVARRWQVDALIRYGREVTRCAFERGRWRLGLS